MISKTCKLIANIFISQKRPNYAINYLNAGLNAEFDNEMLELFKKTAKSQKRYY